ncbi:MAG: hypothetical protein HYZ52_00680 [Candidatus Omnitrophica bacterium]|nr:hypothetical protein [Candidatus Omnitrophota bacterium]
MPFELYFLPPYGRCLKHLGNKEKRIARLVVSALLEYFHSNSPTGNPYMIPVGGRAYRLVFKKLDGAVWEAYIENHVRVLTRLDKHRHFLVFAGNHDQVRQFLKEN